MTWMLAFVSQELKRLFAYRFEFWLRVFGSAAGEFLLAYLLWGIVFSTQNLTTLQGYTFDALIVYFLFVPFFDLLVRGTDFGVISQDIYEGSLSRYLLYPRPYFGIKFSSRIAEGLCALFQLSICLGFASIYIPVAAQISWDIEKIALALFFLSLGSLVYFCLMALCELIAFWADNVWSLTVMLKLVSHFLSGVLIPIDFFPSFWKNLLFFQPFYYFVHFPIQILMGRVGPEVIVRGILVQSCWAIFLSAVLLKVWRRGLKTYSGVGI